MNRSTRTRLLLAILSFAPSTCLVAQSGIPNWTVPPYRQSDASSGLSPMADISPGIAFVAMTPCRVFDTRNPNGAYGGPRLLPNTIRTFDVDGGPCSGIPPGVEAYSMNFGAILPDGLNSFVTIWPTGSSQPNVSSINPIQGAVVANAAIVPAGTGGSISVFPNTGLHLYGDINGYFTASQNPGQSVVAISGTSAPAIIGENTSTAAGAHGVRGVITSTTPGSSSVGVRGINNSTGSVGIGVWGSHGGGGFGVYGTAPTGFGVRGQGASTTEVNIGVSGTTESSATGAAGVEGHANNATGLAPGVRGRTDSATDGASGVLGHADNNSAVETWGVHGTNDSTLGGTPSSGTAGVFGEWGGRPNRAYLVFSSGVRGESKNGIGVVGISEEVGVEGFLSSATTGTALAIGRLGVSFGNDPSSEFDTPPWAVFGTGRIGATSLKFFVDPHPTDPSKVIGYVSLEGPEAGTYVRGRGRIQRGLARIAVPDHFRMVTDPEGLTVQITPIGGMATVGVVRMGLDEVVVQASRDIEFSYLIQGVRRSFRDTVPVWEGNEFRPESPDAKAPAWLSPTQKRTLIENGTYKEDGTVNMETARRLGWDRAWEARHRPRPQPVEVDEPVEVVEP